MKACFSAVKTLLFDYGGTLDTNGRHWSHVLWEAYRTVGFPVSEEAFREAYVYGERYLGSHSVIAPEDDFHTVLLKKVRLEIEACHVLLSEEERETYITEISTWCNDYVLRNMEQTRRILEALQRRYRLGLVSNFYGNLPAVLHAYGLTSYFPVVVESAAVGIRKPDEAIYALGVERTATKAEETVIIGDSFSKDILPARRLGCKSVWFKGETWKPEQNDVSVPDAIITELSELVSILL